MKNPQTRNRLIVAGLLVVLVVAMVLSTRFLTPEEVAAAGPKKFDPTASADELFARAKTELPGKAKPLGEVVPAIQSDPKAAAEKYEAVSPSEGSYVFPVTATGQVTAASKESLTLRVEGVPEETKVLVPVGTAVNGTILRDALGFGFADAPGQTAFQQVGNELKQLMLDEVKSAGDPSSLKGKEVTVVGVTNLTNASGPVPKAKPVNVQPVSIKAGS